MGYFSGKNKSTAESVKDALANIVKDNLQREKAQYDSQLKAGEIPVFQTNYDGAEFSGDGIDEIKKIVEEYYDAYNRYSRYKVRETQEQRKTLFNRGGE